MQDPTACVRHGPDHQCLTIYQNGYVWCPPVTDAPLLCWYPSYAATPQATRLSKLLETTKASEADFAGRHAAAEEAVRAAQAEVAAARQRVVQVGTGYRDGCMKVPVSMSRHATSRYMSCDLM
jgi:hypothetical protein